MPMTNARVIQYLILRSTKPMAAAMVLSIRRKNWARIKPIKSTMIRSLAMFIHPCHLGGACRVMVFVKMSLSLERK